MATKFLYFQSLRRCEWSINTKQPASWAIGHLPNQINIWLYSLRHVRQKV